jgi:hypothetical protein
MGRDAPPSAFDRVEILEQRNQELAAELCRTQSFVFVLHNGEHINTGGRQFHIGLRNELKRILQLHKEHREHDKEVAVRSAKAAHGQLATQIKKIEELGGVASPALAARYAQAADALADIMASDPLDTILY